MALPKKIWKISRFDKGIGNINAEGIFWWAQGLDFEATPPYIRVASKMIKETDSAAVLTLADIYWGVIFESTNYAVNMLDGKFFKFSYPSWSEVHDNPNAWGGLGLFGDEDFLYYASNNYAGRVPKNWTLQTDWLDSWQSFNVSNSAELCPITKFLKFICFGNQRYLAVWDTGASTWNATRITLPPGYVIKWLKSLTDYLVISAHHNADGSALFFWDGISQTYNRVLQLPQVKSLAGVVDKNRLYVITGDAWINLFDGSGLVKLARFPDIELDANYASLININPDAVKVFQGLILIGKGASGFDFSKRFYPGGIWVYNPTTNALYFKHMMSHFAINNQSGYGVLAIGSIMIDQGGNIFRAAWNKGGGTGQYIIDNSMDAGSARPYNWGAFLVTPLLDDEPYRRKRFIQSLLNFWKPLVDNSFARIVLKYNITEQYQRDSRYASGGTSNTFTLGFVPSYWEVGDEVTVLAGNGAVQIRHIQSISGTTLTVDESLYGGASYDSTSYLLLTKFKKIGVIKGNENKEAVNKMLRFNARSKKIQLKIEIWSNAGFTGEWDMGIADISTVYIPDRIIK
ncbi:MAG: hypothetical protein HY006_04035 [Candidatus Sungbacteria bacterium]|nr:hypothetical protein [Candidatus Sungbacteria bacterium]